MKENEESLKALKYLTGKNFQLSHLIKTYLFHFKHQLSALILLLRNLKFDFVYKKYPNLNKC